MTKVFSKILLMKSSGSNFISLPAFYLINWVMKAPKIFWQNNHFENIRADFLKRCQNSHRQTSPETMHFQA